MTYLRTSVTLLFEMPGRVFVRSHFNFRLQHLKQLSFFLFYISTCYCVWFCMDFTVMNVFGLNRLHYASDKNLICFSAALYLCSLFICLSIGHSLQLFFVKCSISLLVLCLFVCLLHRILMSDTDRDMFLTFMMTWTIALNQVMKM